MASKTVERVPEASEGVPRDEQVDLRQKELLEQFKDLLERTKEMNVKKKRDSEALNTVFEALLGPVQAAIRFGDIPMFIPITVDGSGYFLLKTGEDTEEKMAEVEKMLEENNKNVENRIQKVEYIQKQYEELIGNTDIKNHSKLEQLKTRLEQLK